MMVNTRVGRICSPAEDSIKQACKPAHILEMNFFTHIFQNFQLDFKLLYIVSEFCKHFQSTF